jgi:hypothetical protein
LTKRRHLATKGGLFKHTRAFILVERTAAFKATTMQDAKHYDFFRPSADNNQAGGGVIEARPTSALDVAQTNADIKNIKAIQNLPPFEIVRDRLLYALIECDPMATDEQIAYQNVFTRVRSPACHNCVAKGKNVKLSRCTGCYLVSYCSRTCQVKDWTGGNHHRWCRKGDNAQPHTSSVHDMVATKMGKPDGSGRMRSIDKVWDVKDVMEARKGRVWMPDSKTCTHCAPNRDSAKVLESRVCPKCFYGRFCRDCEPEHYADHVATCDGGYFARFGDLDAAARLPKSE